MATASNNNLPSEEIIEEDLRKERLEEQRRKETQAMAKIGVAAGAAYITRDKSHLKDIKGSDVKSAARGAVRQGTTINPIKRIRQQRELKKSVKKETKKVVKKVVKKVLWKAFLWLLPFILILLFVVIIIIALTHYVCEGQGLGSWLLKNAVGLGKLCEMMK